MGCFFACFSACKHRKRRHLVNATPSNQHGDGASEAALQLDESTKQEITEEPVKPIAGSKRKLEEPLSCNGKKKVTFDLNVKTCEALPGNGEVANNIVESSEETESENKEPSNESKSISKTTTSNVTSYPPNHRYQNCENEEYDDLDLEYNLENEDNNGRHNGQVLGEEESSESLFSLSIDSRKQVCGAELENEEYDDLDLEYSLENDDNNGGCDGQGLVPEESSESLFSLSIESRKQACRADLGEKEVTSPMLKLSSPNEELKAVGSNQHGRDTSQCVDSVLNPIKNLIQWQAVKARATSPMQHQDKENITISPEPSFKLLTNNSKVNSNQKKLMDQGIAVDTSLSSWLVESEATPISKSRANSVGNSPSGRASLPRSHEDRPILGAWTIDELNQLSASNSPRRSKNRSPDEMPIIGTVGRYWIHTGRTVDSGSGSSSKGMPSTRSNKGEDERVKWNSTLFEERLERALDTGTAQV